MARTCRLCRFENRPEANFCEACGHPVRHLADIPPEYVDAFRRENPVGYVVASRSDMTEEGVQ